MQTIEARPKKIDRERLTALRTDRVDLIDNMAYADAATFPTQYAGIFQTWDAPALGTAYLTFNLEKGPFRESHPDGKTLRQAAAYATDLEVIDQAVFYGRGDIATGYFPPVSPWHASPEGWKGKYDPQKAKFLLQKAKAMGAVVELIAPDSPPYIQQTAKLLHHMWSGAGFKVNFSLLDSAEHQQKRNAGAFHVNCAAGSYRFDPDGYFSRQVLSTAAYTRQQSRFRNERADQLITEARKTRDQKKRLEMYLEVENIINEELPFLYTHHLTLLEAGVLSLKNYQPAISGAPSTYGAGIRVAWMA